MTSLKKQKASAYVQIQWFFSKILTICIFDVWQEYFLYKIFHVASGACQRKQVASEFLNSGRTMSNQSAGWNMGPNRYEWDWFPWEIVMSHVLCHVMKQSKGAQLTINRVLSLQLQADNSSSKSEVNVRESIMQCMRSKEKNAVMGKRRQ